MGFYSVGALFVIQMFKSSIILSNVELYLLFLLACMIASFFPFRLGNGEWGMGDASYFLSKNKKEEDRKDETDLR